MSETKAVVRQVPANSLIVKFSSQYGVDSDKMLTTLKATAFKTKAGEPEVTNEQMMALLIVADQYHLNPFTKEIFAFPDKKMGIIPVVSVDGWARIVNEHPQFDGLEFNNSDEIITDPEHKDCPASIETVIFRKDRSRPTKTSEYLDEVYRPPFKSKDGYVTVGPWQTHTKRFLRHKSFIQCARLAFGFAGIYDQDEAERIREADDRVVAVQGATRAEQAKAAMAATKTPSPNSVNTVGVVGTDKPSPEQPKPEAQPVVEQNANRGTTESTAKNAPQANDPEQEPPVKTLEEGSIERLKAAQNRKELRVVWGEVIDDYDKVNKEIPPDVEDAYNVKLDFFT